MKQVWLRAIKLYLSESVTQSLKLPESPDTVTISNNGYYLKNRRSLFTTSGRDDDWMFQGQTTALSDCVLLLSEGLFTCE